MFKVVRYHKNNASLQIGGVNTKLTIFTHEKCGCITFKGNRILHFGNWK